MSTILQSTEISNIQSGLWLHFHSQTEKNLFKQREKTIKSFGFCMKHILEDRYFTNK